MDLVGFCRGGRPPEARRRQRRRPSGDVVKQHLGLAGEGFTRGIRTSSKVAVCAPAKVTHLSELLYLKR